MRHSLGGLVQPPGRGGLRGELRPKRCGDGRQHVDSRPGELELPAGRVRVTFEQGTGHAAGGFGPHSGPPKAPQMPGMRVRSVGGGEPIEFSRFGGAKARIHAGRTRALIGSLLVPEAGTYVIDAPEPFDEPSAQHFSHYEAGPDPKLLFG